MSVLLVNPVFTGRTDLPPLGLLSLAAVLLQESLSVEVLDLDIGPLPDPLAKLDETLEICAFIDAALRSSRQGGDDIKLDL